MKFTPVSISKLLEIHRELDHVRYDLGSKTPFSQKAEADRYIDCSGYSRYAIYHSTWPHVTIPDGSWNQLDWIDGLVGQDGIRKLKKYSDVQYAAKDPSRLFICFVKPVVFAGKVVKAGHVWLVHEGLTLESWGGNGVDRRNWNLNFARLRGAVAYELPTGV